MGSRSQEAKMTRHVELRRSIILKGAPGTVFGLFTPAGETLWVEGWAPEYLHPPEGTTQKGMVFRTSHGHEATLWACTEWDPEALHVAYARVTPGSRFGFVDVSCRATDETSTEATIAYSFTALNEAGEALIAHMTASAYDAMMDEWQTTINRYLAERAGAA